MMNPPNGPLPSSTPSASSALLTAALGGLLCFTASCSSQAIAPASDSGAGADTGASVDGGTVVDTGTGRDAGTATDTPVTSTDVVVATDTPVTATDTPVTATDVVAATDTPVTSTDTPVATDTPVTPTDAGSAIDATTAADATTAPDVQPDVPLIVRDAGCDVAADRVVASRDAGIGGMSLTVFVARCNAAGGFVEIHPHCGGANSCAGFSYDQTTDTFSEHNCATLNTCTGYTCVLP